MRLEVLSGCKKERGTTRREGRGSVAPSRAPVLSSTQILPSACYVHTRHSCAQCILDLFFGPELNSSATRVNSQLIDSYQLTAWSCVSLELLALVISPVSHLQPLCYKYCQI